MTCVERRRDVTETLSESTTRREREVSKDDLALVDAWWRAANYLAVGQIYLMDNPLLHEPLRPEHLKPRLLGHWGTTPGLTFLWAHLNRVIVREGLEALLIVIAMLAFLRKADQPQMARPVHYGWIGALAAGLLTWWAATSLISVSGASRELTEGFGSLLAAAVLLFVGIWMHGKAQANEWQRYIKAKLGAALSRRSAWFLFLLAFIAVYREVFETILFFAAMSAEGNVAALVAGGAAGLVILAAIAIAMFRFSARLPIAKFFAYSSALIAVLAVVLAGKGVAALQEAGMLGVTPIAGAPRIEILGLYPTLEGLAAQVATLVILLLGFGWNRRESRKLAVA